MNIYTLLFRSKDDKYSYIETILSDKLSKFNLKPKKGFTLKEITIKEKVYLPTRKELIRYYFKNKDKDIYKLSEYFTNMVAIYTDQFGYGYPDKKVIKMFYRIIDVCNKRCFNEAKNIFNIS